jgi:serine/threonine protein kinase
MADIIRKWTTHEREYIEYKDKFRKRSLAPNEYQKYIHDPNFYASFNMKRLQNEADCLEFIARTTTIPVPRLLAAYTQDGSFILETDRIDGVLMQELSPEKQRTVMPQIRHYLRELRKIHSDKLGGPCGLAFPPQAVVCRPNGCKPWSQMHTSTSTSKLVFSHRDISQSNVYVDPVSLKVVAIGDWEYGGFYPESHELPFFESPKKSGVQVKTILGMTEIKDFWQNFVCAIEDSHSCIVSTEPLLAAR